MGLFPRFLSTRNSLKNPQKWLEDFFSGGGKETIAGTQINEDSAMAISAVFSCVTLISETKASLPQILYKERKGGGRDRAKDHPLYYTLHDRPNPEMTHFSMCEAQTGHLLLWGNKYGLIERNFLGQVLKIWPFEPHKTRFERSKKNRKIEYTYTKSDGTEIKYPAEKIIHVPAFSYNGINGQSVVGFQREKLGIASALDEFEARFFGHGTNPGAVITMPVEAQGMDLEEQKKYLAHLKDQFGKLQNSHGLLLLPNGEKFTRAAMPLEDAQFLDLYKAKAVDICGWFKVPPHMIGILDHATFSNIEHQAIQFAVNCIRPWLVRDEQAINAKLLTERERREGYYVENLIDGLLRGDKKAQSEFYKAMFNIGAMSPNDIRTKENMNPYQGGEKYFVPINMITPDQASQPMENKNIRMITTRSAQLERRSILVRDRIAQQYYPLFRKAAQEIVNREGVAVKKQVNKQRKKRARSSMDEWLREFYAGMPDYVRSKFGPIITSYAEAFRDAATEEVGSEPDEAEFQQFVEAYLARYIERHISSSLGQLLSLDNLDDIEERVDEWEEKRPDKIAADETVRNGNGIYQFVAFAAGMTTRWAIRGASTCPYCKTLRGKVVARGQTFVDDGDSIEAKEADGKVYKMKVRGKKSHPPLHQGCDCYLTIW